MSERRPSTTPCGTTACPSDGERCVCPDYDRLRQLLIMANIDGPTSLVVADVVERWLADENGPSRGGEK